MRVPIAVAALCVLVGSLSAVSAGEQRVRTVLPPEGAPPPAVYGFGAPPARWGWFGAQYRPRSVSHHGFYGDYWQWSYRRGY